MKVWHLMVGFLIAVLITTHIKTVVSLLIGLLVLIGILILAALCGAAVWLIDLAVRRRG